MAIVLVIFMLGLCFYLLFKNRKVVKELTEFQEKYSSSQISFKNLLDEKNALKKDVESLEKYKVIKDIQAEFDSVKTEIERATKEARERDDEERKKMQSELKRKVEEGEKIVSEARINARQILNNAELEAKRIAGSAFDAMKKVDQLEKTAKAMKNIIEGYGDQYIIPTNNLIDNLAEDYSHTQAGDDLKKIRASVKEMVKDGKAADCDYVENNRKETAIDFILDAFNGKVDSIMSLVKNDNFGTLSQKIKDAFVVVNTNGAAFRSARINQEYLNLRLEELKYASMVQALKEKEREEQRRIREQIREEEKAAKEYERALKEAQKEEETVAKAMEKVKKDLEEASEQKKKFYEEKLLELEKKLKEAEEKNKRAQSMAELTKSGHVYIISNIGSFGENVLKIGMTRRLEPQDRVDELGDASVPFDFDVHAMIYSDDAPSLEKELHRKFSDRQVNKVNSRKEFFNIEIAELRALVEQKGIQVHWTMTAEAREYRESLSIKNNFKEVA